MVLTRQVLEDAKRRFAPAQNLVERKQNELVSMQAQVDQRTEALEPTLEELRLARVAAEQMAVEMKNIESSPPYCLNLSRLKMWMGLFNGGGIRVRFWSSGFVG